MQLAYSQHRAGRKEEALEVGLVEKMAKEGDLKF
jgi:hypothetical protein